MEKPVYEVWIELITSCIKSSYDNHLNRKNPCQKLEFGNRNFLPAQIAKEAIFLINNNEHLKKQKENLSKQRGKTGAVKKLAYIILNSIKKSI